MSRSGIDSFGDPRKAPGFGDLLARYVEQLNATGFVDPDEGLAT